MYVCVCNNFRDVYLCNNKICSLHSHLIDPGGIDVILIVQVCCIGNQELQPGGCETRQMNPKVGQWHTSPADGQEN